MFTHLQRHPAAEMDTFSVVFLAQLPTCGFSGGEGLLYL